MHHAFPVPPVPSEMVPSLSRPSLPARLDAVLLTLPAVRGVGADPTVETLAAAHGMTGPGGLVVRRVRLADGRRLSLAALPSATWRHPDTRSGARALCRAAGHIGRRTLLVTEAALDREPRLATALLVAACAAAAVAPRDHLALLTAMVEAGGEMALADAAEVATASADGVAAVLALVARRVLIIDTRRPLGPETAVSVAGPWGGR